ncbi:DM10 domain-containing protein [Balamuthia mandrillaris]
MNVMPSSCSRSSSSKPRLVLHFDVNKTLLMADAAEGKDLDQCLNNFLADTCFGRVVEEDGEQKRYRWEAVSDEPKVGPAPPGLLSYFHFVEKHATNKQQHKQMRDTFTHIGQPGRKYSSFLLRLKQKLLLKPQKEQEREEEEEEEEQRYHVIVPSFYRLLRHLKETERSFTLVFRTFGEDLPKLQKEFNAFCEGQAGIYPGIDEYRITDESKGCFFRNGPKSQDTHLILGTWEPVPDIQLGLQFYHEGDEKEDDEGRRKVLTGFRSVWELTNDPSVKILAFRDYYRWWAMMGEKHWSGKPFVLHQNKKTQKALLVEAETKRGEEGEETAVGDLVHHIFFDDNVWIPGYQEKGNNIVDIRDLETGETICPIESLDVHIVRVEPMLAIQDENYFITCLEKCEENFALRSQERETL